MASFVLFYGLVHLLEKQPLKIFSFFIVARSDDLVDKWRFFTWDIEEYLYGVKHLGSQISYYLLFVILDYVIIWWHLIFPNAQWPNGVLLLILIFDGCTKMLRWWWVHLQGWTCATDTWSQTKLPRELCLFDCFELF